MKDTMLNHVTNKKFMYRKLYREVTKEIENSFQRAEFHLVEKTHDIW